MWKLPTIILHWLSVIFIIGALLTKKISTGAIGSIKLSMLQTHIIFGIGFIILLIFRVYFKLKNRKTNPKSGKLATSVHHLLYTTMVLLALSGLILGFKGIFSFAFLGAPFPERFFINSPVFELHALFGYILIGLIALHLLVTLFHIYKKGNHSFSRMIGINKKDEDS